MELYPLKFCPRLVEKIWGGRKLETILGKPLPPEKRIGESWELYDFPPGVVEPGDEWCSSVVAEGPLAGRTLHALIEQFGADLYGTALLRTAPREPTGQFPLLLKYLDAREDLSVQVHPPATYAAAHPGTYLKTEAWYVVQSEPGARLLKGLTPGVTPERLREAIVAGTVESAIQPVAVKPGHCHFLPSGTIHALGAGILVAEIQTPSDTTFRLFDFNRIDPATGKPRSLHIEQALECIDFSGDSESRQKRSHVGSYWTTVSRLVSCDFFIVEKVRMSGGVEQPVSSGEPMVWMMLEGRAEVRTAGGGTVSLGKGETVLFPATLKSPVLKTAEDCVWLEITFARG